MNLKEKIVAQKEEERHQSKELEEQRKERKMWEENRQAEMQKELDELVLIAQEKLIPFLNVVNEIERDNEGQVKIDSWCPQPDYKDTEKTIEERRSKLHVTAMLQEERSDWSFGLYLRLDRDGNVEICGIRRKAGTVNLADENASEKIENAILFVLPKGGCEHTNPPGNPMADFF